ncbi:hypothetical protein ACI79C_15155 [Geodermatophilus sp. SYSU D00697]
MEGTTSKALTRATTRIARLLLALGVAAVALVVTPGTASATGGVTGIVSCYTDNLDGSYTVVVGYTSSYPDTVTLPLGPTNQAYPTRLQGAQPTVFKPGTHHAAFTVQITNADLWANARWELDGTVLQYNSLVSYATVCPSSTQMPADGNGSGPVIALAAAGLVGAVAVVRSRRRAAATTEPAAPEVTGA